MKEFFIIFVTTLIFGTGTIIQLIRHPNRKENGEGPYYIGGFFADIVFPWSIAALVEVFLIWVTR